MTTDFEDREKLPQDSKPEKFSKVRTIPSKWDVSAFSSHSRSSRHSCFDKKTIVDDQVEANASALQVPDRWRDSFPMPETIPAKWDTSGLTKVDVKNECDDSQSKGI